MKIAGLYGRVSTKKQDLESMRKRLLDWAKENDYEYNLYEDFAVSGMKNKRDGIDALLEDARAGRLNVVAVVELSRIGRSIGFICSTIKELAELNIPIILVNTNTTVDYNTLEGSAMVNALAMAADIEYRLIQDRNARGRQAIKDRGIKVGRKHKEVSDEAIKALLERNFSLRMIGKELGVSAATIMRRVKKGGQIPSEDKDMQTDADKTDRF